MRSYQEVPTLRGHDSYVFHTAFSPDGTLIATPGADGTLKLWNAGRYQESIVLNHHNENVASVSFDSQEKRVHSESQNEKRVWDVVTHSMISDAEWTPPANPVLASPDSRWLVASQMDKVVLVDLEFKDSPRDDRQPVFGHLRR